jgi:porin
MGADTPPPVQIRYTSDLLSNVSGGLRKGTGWLGRFDLALDKSGDIAGISGAEAHFDLMLLHGARFSRDYAGDAQTLSNIDAPRAIRPFEAWLQVPLGQQVRVKAGYIDLNSEFDVQSVGTVFLNSSFGIAPDFSQSGLNGPSIFPITSLGLVVAAHDNSNRTISFGLFDAKPGDPDRPHAFWAGGPGRDGALLVAEANIPINKSGELQLGAWRYTNRFDRIDGSGEASSGGAYALVQGLVAGDDDGMALRGWARIGIAAAKVEPIGVYVGGGITYGENDRLLGLGIAHARLGQPALQSDYGDRRAETAFELTAYRTVTPFFAIQPDVQYIVHPSWRSDVSDALVLGLRLHFQWSPKGG